MNGNSSIDRLYENVKLWNIQVVIKLIMQELFYHVKEQGTKTPDMCKSTLTKTEGEKSLLLFPKQNYFHENFASECLTGSWAVVRHMLKPC